MAGLSEQIAGTLIDVLTLSSGITGATTVANADARLAGAVTIAVASTGVAYSKSFPLPRNCSFGWAIKCSSSGAISVKVELEQSMVRPTTEGAADTTNYAVPDNKTTAMFTAIADSSLHYTAYAPNALPYGRLKFTGTGSNDASTKIVLAQMYVTKDSF